MFKHLLIPTDGSELSNVAVVNGVRFAKEIGAKITGLTVTPEGMQIADTRERYDRDIEQVAHHHLATLKQAAEQVGVPCELVHASSDHPYEEIVKTAEHQDCDVIFLASHGRRGVRAVIMGSETTKVLTHTKIPVVVYR
jgi:nucleotide-binding universal stress UspA family protein